MEQQPPGESEPLDRYDQIGDRLNEAFKYDRKKRQEQTLYPNFYAGYLADLHELVELANQGDPDHQDGNIWGIIEVASQREDIAKAWEGLFEEAIDSGDRFEVDRYVQMGQELGYRTTEQMDQIVNTPTIEVNETIDPLGITIHGWASSPDYKPGFNSILNNTGGTMIAVVSGNEASGSVRSARQASQNIEALLHPKQITPTNTLRNQITDALGESVGGRAETTPSAVVIQVVPRGQNRQVVVTGTADYQVYCLRQNLEIEQFPGASPESTGLVQHQTDIYEGDQLIVASPSISPEQMGHVLDRLKQEIGTPGYNMVRVPEMINSIMAQEGLITDNQLVMVINTEAMPELPPEPPKPASLARRIREKIPSFGRKGKKTVATEGQQQSPIEDNKELIKILQDTNLTEPIAKLRVHLRENITSDINKLKEIKGSKDLKDEDRQRAILDAQRSLVTHLSDLDSFVKSRPTESEDRDPEKKRAEEVRLKNAKEKLQGIVESFKTNPSVHEAILGTLAGAQADVENAEGDIQIIKRRSDIPQQDRDRIVAILQQKITVQLPAVARHWVKVVRELGYEDNTDGKSRQIMEAANKLEGLYPNPRQPHQPSPTRANRQQYQAAPDTQTFNDPNQFNQAFENIMEGLRDLNIPPVEMPRIDQFIGELLQQYLRLTEVDRTTGNPAISQDELNGMLPRLLDNLGSLSSDLGQGEQSLLNRQVWQEGIYKLVQNTLVAQVITEELNQAVQSGQIQQAYDLFQLAERVGVIIPREDQQRFPVELKRLMINEPEANPRPYGTPDTPPPPASPIVSSHRPASPDDDPTTAVPRVPLLPAAPISAATSPVTPPVRVAPPLAPLSGDPVSPVVSADTSAPIVVSGLQNTTSGGSIEAVQSPAGVDKVTERFNNAVTQIQAVFGMADPEALQRLELTQFRGEYQRWQQAITGGNIPEQEQARDRQSLIKTLNLLWNEAMKVDSALKIPELWNNLEAIIQDPIIRGAFEAELYVANDIADFAEVEELLTSVIKLGVTAANLDYYRRQVDDWLAS